MVCMARYVKSIKVSRLKELGEYMTSLLRTQAFWPQLALHITDRQGYIGFRGTSVEYPE